MAHFLSLRSVCIIARIRRISNPRSPVESALTLITPSYERPPCSEALHVVHTHRSISVVGTTQNLSRLADPIETEGGRRPRKDFRALDSKKGRKLPFENEKRQKLAKKRARNGRKRPNSSRTSRLCCFSAVPFCSLAFALQMGGRRARVAVINTTRIISFRTTFCSGLSFRLFDYADSLTYLYLTGVLPWFSHRLSAIFSLEIFFHCRRLFTSLALFSRSPSIACVSIWT